MTAAELLATDRRHHAGLKGPLPNIERRMLYLDRKDLRQELADLRQKEEAS